MFYIMNTNFFKCFLIAFVITSTSTALASSKSELKPSSKLNDYYADYYESEGSLLFKIRPFYAYTEAKMKDLPPIKNPGAKKPKSLVQGGYGFDTAMTIFVTDNIAAEVSMGVSFYKTKSSALIGVRNAYGSGTEVGKRNQIIMVPFTITAQYHLAPFGGIRPYIGGGYNGTYMYTPSKAIKVGNGHGPVIQAGVDFISKDDTLFTFDIRQYLLKSKVTFRESFLNTSNDMASKITWNPIVISVGVGFKF